MSKLAVAPSGSSGDGINYSRPPAEFPEAVPPSLKSAKIDGMLPVVLVYGNDPAIAIRLTPASHPATPKAKFAASALTLKADGSCNDHTTCPRAYPAGVVKFDDIACRVNSCSLSAECKLENNSRRNWRNRHALGINSAP